jgi:hypothetical protein
LLAIWEAFCGALVTIVTMLPFYELIFGGDTQTGASPLYIWLADQFGHIFIGFGCVFLVGWIVASITRRAVPSYQLARPGARSAESTALSTSTVLTIGIGVLAFWVLKEVADLCLANWSSSQWIVVSYSDMISDFFTDIAFYSIGIALAFAHFGVFRLKPLPTLLLCSGVAALLGVIWVPIWIGLGETNIPFMARMTSVELVPEAHATRMENVLPEISSAPEKCLAAPSQPQPAVDMTGNRALRSQGQANPVLDCVVGNNCPDKTHYIVYGLKRDEMPELPDPDRLNARPDTEQERQAKVKNIKAVLPQMRRLGVSLVVERVIADPKATAHYSTLAQSIENDVQQSFLVLDNLERDITRYALRVSPLAKRTEALTAIFEGEIQTLQQRYAEKSVVWLSLNELTAVALCKTLSEKENRGLVNEVILIRAHLPSKAGHKPSAQVASHH